MRQKLSLSRGVAVLSAALFASLAMGVSVSAASGAQFNSETSNTTFAAGQASKHKMSFNFMSLICTDVTFMGFQEGKTSASLSLAPTYGGCEFEEMFEMTVKTNGCDYVFHADSTTQGTMDIATCGATKYIQLGSLATCRVRIPEQSGLGPIQYQQSGNKVLTTLAISGLKYEESGLFCAGSGSYANGSYSGSSLVTGYSSGMEVKFWVE